MLTPFDATQLYAMVLPHLNDKFRNLSDVKIVLVGGQNWSRFIIQAVGTSPPAKLSAQASPIETLAVFWQHLWV